MKKRFKSRVGRGFVRLALTRPDGMALYGAAYIMSQSAFVVLGEERGEKTVTLRPKPGVSLADLIPAFRKEYLNQVYRWRIARLGLRERSDSIGLMLRLGARLQEHGTSVSPALSPERSAEIDRLLQEAQARPWDPLGIAAPWKEPRR